MRSGFRFAVGIEDTFVPHAFPGHRALDEYELTQHYRFWPEDLGLAAETGATAIRYGFPWYRLNPAPGRFVWDWADRVVERLGELGLEAIVDLVHYGTPLWLDNAFLNADFPVRLAEYAAALAARYRGRLMVTETSSLGGIGQRLAWLDASLELVAGLRDQGLEIVGYTWWPLFDLADWEYRDAHGLVGEHLVKMGLYDLEPDEIGTLRRRRTSVVDRFRSWTERMAS
jgi:beta-glucosidase/6-phospho-beta-glucosidase/beta-galactosidase